MNRTSFFGRHALAILCLIFFLVPFAFRGARMALERMENNVKDWLPSDFPETAELEWFGKHFMGEQFVLATWEGCTADDPSYKLFVDKIKWEIAPQTAAAPGQADAVDADAVGADAVGADAVGAEPGGGAPPAATAEGDPPLDPESPAGRAALKLAEVNRARTLGDRLGLYVTGNYHDNWGGQEERWLRDKVDQWYYVTPKGEFFRWSGRNNLVGWIVRTARRMTGTFELTGELLGTFGNPPSLADRNDFHDDPRKLTARLFGSITTGPDVLAELSAEGGPMWPRGGDYSDAERAEIARNLAMDRLKGTLYGPDGKQTCVVVTLSEAGKFNKRRVVGRGMLGKPKGKLVQLAQEAGVTPPPLPPITPFGSEAKPGGNVLRMGGPPVDNVAIDEEGEITLFRLVGFSVLLGLVLSYVCFRSLKITIMVFFVGGIGAVSSLSIVWWGGGTLDAVLMSMPSLIYVLGLSGAVHIVNYYRDAVAEGGVERAAERALSHGWWPCTLAALTTSLGLLSLCTSNIIPIFKFGLFSALGVMATLVMLFAYLPAALQVFPPGRRNPSGESSGTPRVGLVEAIVSRFWDGVGRFVIQRHMVVTAGCVCVLAVFAFGLTKIGTDIQLLKLFDQDAKIIRDYTWLEHNLGKLVPMELVVRFDPKLIQSAGGDGEMSDEQRSRELLKYSLLERMEVADRIQRAVEQELGMQGEGVVGRGVSAATFAPPLPKPDDRSRLVLNTKLNDSRDRMLAEDYLAVEGDGAELWRISLRLGALNDVDYGRYIYRFREVAEPIQRACAFRDEALTKMTEARGDKTLWNSRVYVLGAGRPEDKTEVTQVDRTRIRPVSATSADQVQAGPAVDADVAGAPVVGGVPTSEMIHDRQHALFLRTLNDLFVGRGYRTSARAKKMLLWHDPEKESLAELGATSDKWAQWLGRFDCLILAADHSDYDVAFIREVAEKQGIPLIDARDHFYLAGQEAPPTARQAGEPVSVVYTGVVPIVYKAQDTLLTSLIQSIGWAFVMIAAVMMLLLRNGRLSPTNVLNFRGGLLSMLPNVFPVAVIFGAMGHLGIKVDIGSMMTASVAMGVAVDDTIHFLAWFRTGMSQGMSRPDAIRLAYKRVATAMTQTTVIGGMGLAVFAMSTFTPTQKFGVLMLVLLAAALVGDLVFLPALLAGPLGRYFGRAADPQLAEGQFVDEQLANEQVANEQVAGDQLASDQPRSSAVPAAHRRPTGANRPEMIRRDNAH